MRRTIYPHLDRLMPPLGTKSQLTVVVIDSQGVSSIEPGPGAARDALATAECAALIADANSNYERALAALAVANDAVRVALANQEALACEPKKTADASSLTLLEAVRRELY